MSRPRFSVVIPTRNGAATLPALLDSVWSQKTAGGLEIIAIDSGSNDTTPEILAQKSIRVIKIRPEDFDHGTTRNRAIAQAHGEFIVLLVQDARLIGDDFLETLARPFAGDPALAGTFARQRARPDASALTRYYLDRWIASSAAPWRSAPIHSRAELDALSPAERMARCTFDNVGACIRRSVWEQHPFPATPIAEDLEWAREVLLAGHALAFVPDAVLEHSHDRSAAYEYARTRVLHARLHDLFGLQTIPTAPALAVSMITSLARHLQVEWRNPVRWPRAAALAVAWPLGQYIGARRAKAGDTRPRTRNGGV